MSSIFPRRAVYRVMLVQLALTAAAALIAWLHSDVAAGSALLGGLTCAVPNAYFLWRAFRYSGARSADKVVQSIYQGEAWKFLLTALCFAVIFVRVEPLNVPALFIAFMTVQLGHLASARIANL
ncbi:ATP synthase subunit I [Bacterioplanoides pacificum]|uniref:ATP synthase subunit I n=1 Tax=Bacterioplanoides pacificum TaxID=1171596 RepID=A0ABV7VQB5_9GAMM